MTGTTTPGTGPGGVVPGQGGDALHKLAVAGSVALSLGSVGMFMASASRISAATAIGAGVLLALLPVYGLTSLGPARSALGAQFVGLVGLIRLLAVPGADASWILPWAVGLVATLVLVNWVPGTGTPLPGTSQAGWHGRALRAVAATSVVVLALTLLLGPQVADRVADASASGGEPSLRQTSPSLLAGDFLDTTVRPKLSDEVVMTVRSSAPSFWRGEVYDVWDGRTWTRSDQQPLQTIADGVVAPAPEDLGARSSVTLKQTVRLVASASTIIFGAPSPVEVEAPVAVMQRPDGSLVSEPIGQGTSYTVISHRLPVTRAVLLAANGRVPPAVRARYAAPPVASDRTVAAAERVTRSAPTTLQKVEALERWMGSVTKYSIEARPAPKNVDVVDDFLFESRRGWCEQIASSLVVLLRSVGVPARLATGFVPGSTSSLTDVYTVRAHDAHAWAEVWFPGIGWQSFDPTAKVPFAGDSGHRSAFDFLRDNILWFGLLIVIGGALRLAVPLARRKGSARPARVGWAGATLRRMERLGASAARPRLPHETATAYGGTLARALGDDGLAAVGRLIDDDRFRPEPVGHADRERADSVLARVESR